MRYSEGSGFFRTLAAPHLEGQSLTGRFASLIKKTVTQPADIFKALTVKDYAKQTVIMLYMRTLDGTIRFKRGLLGQLTTELGEGPAPTASIPEATELANRMAEKIDGVPEHGHRIATQHSHHGSYPEEVVWGVTPMRA